MTLLKIQTFLGYLCDYYHNNSNIVTCAYKNELFIKQGSSTKVVVGIDHKQKIYTSGPFSVSITIMPNACEILKKLSCKI